MNTRQKLTLGIAAIFMVTLTIVGVTYAYFVTRVTGDVGTETVNVSTANLASVKYVAGNATAGQTDLIKMTDIMPGEMVYKTFAVQNDSAAAEAYYDVFLQTVPVVSATAEGGDYAIPFVHAQDTTKCYTDTAYDNRSTLTECYDSTSYNNILYTLYEVEKSVYDTYNVAAVNYTTANDPTGTVIGEAGSTVTHGATNKDPQVIANDQTIDKAGDNSTADNTDDDIPTVKYYVLKVEYKNVNGNQNIENKATLDIKVDIR